MAAVSSRADRWYNYIRLNGFSAEEAQTAVERHPAYKGAAPEPLQFTVVRDKTRIDAGPYRFTVVETPGHSPGHVCLYEPDRNILLAGDHLLGDITPNIGHWSETGNPLDDFLHSLAKVDALPIDLVLPGHRRLFRNCRDRIAELVDHHRRRADEVYVILAGGAMTAYQVASRMTWDMTCAWEQFPPPQKFFATGEALAHLRYLEVKGLITRQVDGELASYHRLPRQQPTGMV